MKPSLTEVANLLNKAAQRMSELAAATNGHVPASTRTVIPRTVVTYPAKKAKPSPALVLHGRYLGAIHHLSKTQRERIKKIRAAKGVHAAIREAKRAASR